MSEIRINTRGCKKPISKKTIQAVAELLKAAYRRERKKQNKQQKDGKECDLE